MKDAKIAETSIKTLRGYPFFGKPMRLNFARTESDFMTKLSGSFDEAVKKKRNIRHE